MEITSLLTDWDSDLFCKSSIILTEILHDKLLAAVMLNALKTFLAKGCNGSEDAIKIALIKRQWFKWFDCRLRSIPYADCIIILVLFRGKGINVMLLFPLIAIDMCTTNCSHYLHCETRQSFYFCTCQAGFTGFHCNVNIDDCSSSPCVHGKCVDGVNLYECVCSKGYWGANCENKIENEEGR